MILFENHLVELTYEVKNDILTVIWPDLPQDSVYELEYVMLKLLNAVSHYDIKRLLLDSSKSVIEIEERVYKRLVFNLIKGLNNTRLKKMARIISESSLRENKLKGYAQEMDAKRMFSFEAGEFDNKEEAIIWLCKER